MISTSMTSRRKIDMDCRDCEYYARTHYRGTPADELYDECECHWEVLHSLEICKDFKEVKE